MRTNEFTGVYHMHEEISPEAYKAQRLQELADLAEYRSRHLAAIQSWSNEENRLERIAQHKVEEAAARATWKPEDHYSGMKLRLEERVSIIPLIKPRPKKRSWWARLWEKA